MNAIDASPQDARIELRIAQDGDSGFMVEIEDAGSGIPAEIGERVFEAFYTTKKDIGTGLGLWVSRQLMERVGGKISFTPNAGGHGTCFRVYFPAAGTGNRAAA